MREQGFWKGERVTDERKGLTSASSAERHSLCPGSYLLERDQPQITTPEAESGTRIHEALATGDSSNLSLEETETYCLCREVEEGALARWGKVDRGFAEQRLWIDGHPAHSGKADRVYFDDKGRARVSDFKTGRNEAPESSTNLQLRDLAALVWTNYPQVTEVTVEIIQPWVTRTPTPCVYDSSDLKRACEEMVARVEQSHRGGPRTPSFKACQYCRAKKICPEYLASVTLPVQTPAQSLPTLPQVREAIALLPDQKLGQFFALSKMANEVVEAELRARIEAGSAETGYKLSPGRTTEKITDAQQVFERFVSAGGTTEQFLSTITVGKKKLKEAVAEITGSKGASLQFQTDAMLAGCCESKTGSAVLEKE